MNEIIDGVASSAAASRAAVMIAALSISVFVPSGCNEQVDPLPDLSSQQIIQRLAELDATVLPVQAKAIDGVARAFMSSDREERVAAIIAYGKSKHVTASMKEILLAIATDDSDPLVRAAALRSLYQLGRPSPELKSLSQGLRADPLLGPIVDDLAQAKRN